MLRKMSGALGLDIKACWKLWDETFLGDRERHKDGFMRVLEIVRRLSEEDGGGLYELGVHKGSWSTYRR